MQYTKNQEHFNFHGKRTTCTKAKMSQMLELSDKDFKMAIIKSKKGKNLLHISGKTESLNKETENIKQKKETKWEFLR